MFADCLLKSLDERFPDLGSQIKENRLGNFLHPALKGKVF